MTGHRARLGAATLVSAVAALGASPATAKEIPPGELLVCGQTRCFALRDRPLLRSFSAFLYDGRRPQAAVAPALGSEAYALRFPEGYVVGLVAGALRDRFLSYGVNLGRFLRGRWHRLPGETARRLRLVVSSLEPRMLTRGAIRRSR